MKVKNIMTENAITTTVDSNLEEAAKLMLDNNIGCLPVVDDKGDLVGILTESDFCAKEHGIPFSRVYEPQLFGKWMSKEGVEQAYEIAKTLGVKEIMTNNVITVQDDEPISKVVSNMLENNLHRIPVLKGNKLVGIVSRRDLLKLLVGSK